MGISPRILISKHNFNCLFALSFRKIKKDERNLKTLRRLNTKHTLIYLLVFNISIAAFPELLSA